MKTENDRISVREAAAMLGMSEQGVKEHMKRNIFNPPIGHVTQVGKSRKQYHIYRSMIERYVGRENRNASNDSVKQKSPEELIGEAVLQMIQQIAQTVVNVETSEERHNGQFKNY